MMKGVCIVMAVCMMMLAVGCSGDPTAVSGPSAATATTATTLPQTQRFDTLSFTGRVLEVQADGAAMLVACVGDCALGDRAWVQLGEVPDFTPQVGDTYTITYADTVMLSLPPRVVALTVCPAVTE